DKEVVEPAPAVPLGPAKEHDVDAELLADLARAHLPRLRLQDLLVNLGAVRSRVVDLLVLAKRLDNLLNVVLAAVLALQKIEAEPLEPSRLPLPHLARGD